MRQEFPHLPTIESTGPLALANIFFSCCSEETPFLQQWQVFPVYSENFRSLLFQESLFQRPSLFPALLHQCSLSAWVVPSVYSCAPVFPIWVKRLSFDPTAHPNYPLTSPPLSTANPLEIVVFILWQHRHPLCLAFVSESPNETTLVRFPVTSMFSNPVAFSQKLTSFN